MLTYTERKRQGREAGMEGGRTDCLLEAETTEYKAYKAFEQSASHIGLINPDCIRKCSLLTPIN